MCPWPCWNVREESDSAKVRKRTRFVKQTDQAQHKGCIHPSVRAASKEWLTCSYSFFRIIAPLPLYFVKNGVGRYVCARLVEAWLRFGRNVEPFCDAHKQVGQSRKFMFGEQNYVQVKISTLVRHGGRSEEHTSELQSLMRRSYAVFCLTKKTIKDNNNTQE